MKRKELVKRNIQEDGENEGKDGEPKGIVEHALEEMSSSVLGGAILEWSNKIDEIRVKSKNFQGKLNGEMKRCVIQIKEGTSFLVARSEASGDPQFLRMRNSELVSQLREAERENARLKEQLKRTSPIPSSPLRKRRSERMIDGGSVAQGSSGNRAVPKGTKVGPPLTGEAFPPLPQRPPRKVLSGKGEGQEPPLQTPSLAICDSDSDVDTETFLTKRINLLVTARNMEKERKSRRRSIQQGMEQLGLLNEEENRVIQEGSKKVGPRIVSNIMVALPFKERLGEGTALEAPGSGTEWKVVANKKKRGRHKSDELLLSPPPAARSSADVLRERNVRIPDDSAGR